MFINNNHLNLGNLQIPNEFENTSYMIFLQVLNKKINDEVKVENTLLPN